MDANKIGAFIKELRMQKNTTQKELAEIINCTDKAISRWETGRGVPEVSLLMPLSKALDISVNELLTGERFIPEQKSEVQEQYKDLVMVPVIISRTDEAIVDVIMEKDEEIKSRSSPTITAFLARYIIGKQLAISHCDASSMIATSNIPGFIGSEPETA